VLIIVRLLIFKIKPLPIQKVGSGFLKAGNPMSDFPYVSAIKKISVLIHSAFVDFKIRPLPASKLAAVFSRKEPNVRLSLMPSSFKRYKC
jgi:hypothetical protein